MHRQYFMFILLFSFYALRGTDSQSNPVITYSCDASKTIISLNLIGGNFSHIRLVGKNSFCDPDSYNEAGVLKCINFLKTNQTDTKAISLLYEDLTQKGFTGGSNIKYFLLSCKEKSSNQIASLKGIDVKPSAAVKPTEVLAVSAEKPALTIKEGPTHIYVGTKIKLQLEIDATHILLPATCTAYQQASDPKEYQFWKYCNKNLSDVSIMPALIWTGAIEGDKYHATIDMYAFRFIDTSRINIKCEVLVCQKVGSTACAQNCPATSRKRRQANANVTTATASLAFDVLESRHFEVNGCQGLSAVWYIYASSFGIMYWITVNKF